MSTQGCDHHGYGVHFFKIILESNIRDGELRMPKSFVRRYWQGISNPVCLRLPNSTEWKVYWMKRDGDVWFRDGWKEFAQYLSLDVSQFVVFRYEENSHFNVIILGKSGLELEYPSRVTVKEEEGAESDYSVKIVEYCSPFEGEREKSPPPSSRTRKKMKTNPKEEQTDAGFDNAKHMNSGSSRDLKSTRLRSPVSCPQPRNKLKTSTRGNQSQGTNFDKSKIAAAKKELDEDKGATTECLKVKQLTSNNPSFMVVMKPTYVDNHYLRVPTKFAKKYLKEKQRDILLQVLDGRTWPCTYSFSRINAGWNKFVSDNNLKVGDVCLFELSKSRGLSLKVLIFPLKEEPHSSFQGRKASQRASPLIRPSPNTNGVLKKAYKVALENPFFTVNIRPRDQYRPLVPVAFVRKYFIHNRQIVKLQFGKKLWPVKFLCYPHNSAAMLSRGWFQFARECKLVVGDICVFELINKEDAVFDVHIFRGHS